LGESFWFGLCPEDGAKGDGLRPDVLPPT